MAWRCNSPQRTFGIIKLFCLLQSRQNGNHKSIEKMELFCLQDSRITDCSSSKNHKIFFEWRILQCGERWAKRAEKCALWREVRLDICNIATSVCNVEIVTIYAVVNVNFVFWKVKK